MDRNILRLVDAADDSESNQGDGCKGCHGQADALRSSGRFDRRVACGAAATVERRELSRIRARRSALQRSTRKVEHELRNDSHCDARDDAPTAKPVARRVDPHVRYVGNAPGRKRPVGDACGERSREREHAEPNRPSTQSTRAHDRPAGDFAGRCVRSGGARDRDRVGARVEGGRVPRPRDDARNVGPLKDGQRRKGRCRNVSWRGEQEAGLARDAAHDEQQLDPRVAHREQVGCLARFNDHKDIIEREKRHSKCRVDVVVAAAVGILGVADRRDPTQAEHAKHRHG